MAAKFPLWAFYVRQDCIHLAGRSCPMRLPPLAPAEAHRRSVSRCLLPRCWPPRQIAACNGGMFVVLAADPFAGVASFRLSWLPGRRHRVLRTGYRDAEGISRVLFTNAMNSTGATGYDSFHLPNYQSMFPTLPHHRLLCCSHRSPNYCIRHQPSSTPR